MKPEIWISLLLIICCAVIPLMALGGAGIFVGILSGQGLLVAVGLVVLILGVYFYFRKGI